MVTYQGQKVVRTIAESDRIIWCLEDGTIVVAPKRGGLR